MMLDFVYFLFLLAFVAIAITRIVVGKNEYDKDAQRISGDFFSENNWMKWLGEVFGNSWLIKKFFKKIVAIFQ